MYRILAGGDLIFDALSDSACVASASISQSVNAAAYLDMSVDPRGCPDIEEGVTSIEVLWDSETLFHGTVSETSLDIDGMLSVTAVSDVDALNRVLARPHSTDGSVGEKCPGTLSGYFQWLMSQFNQRNVGGYRIDVGVNQGDLIRGTGIAVSEDGYPTVASLVDSEVLSYGGYLDFTPFSGGGTIDLYADIHEASGQMVDFGQNVVDISVTRSTEGQRTAVIPYCGDLTISGASESDRQLVANAGLVASGDALYDPDAVARYGYREERYEVEGTGSVADLVREGIARLRTVMAPTVTIECRAVDMALYMDGYDHLRVGQAVRVRSVPHGVDEYLAVQDMALDLMDPSQTAYTLGVAYDTLTGGQSARLRELNLGIDHALDRVDGMQSQVDGVAGDVQQVQQDVEGVRKDVTEAVDVANGAQQAAEDAKDAADAAKDAASKAEQAADEMSGQIEGVNVKIEGLQGDLDHVSTQVSGAVESASAALEASSQAVQDVNGFKTTVSQTYATKDELSKETLDRESAITQSAESILAQVSENYVDKETGATLATKTEVEQSAEGIRSEVASEYQSKDGMSAYATKSYVDQRDDSISSTVSQVSQTADSALEKASTVEQTASGLEVRLTQAESDVDAAQGAAEDAAKTATNYLGFSSGGLVVGDQTGTSLGNNVRIDSDSVDIRDGSTTLASFGANIIDIGSTTTATVSLANALQIYVSGGSSTISSGNPISIQSNNGSVVVKGTKQTNIGNSVSGTVNIFSGNGISIGSAGTEIRGIHEGTVVVTISGTTATLFSSAQYRAIVGRPYKSGDCVLVCNGDRNANTLGPIASVNPSNGYWYVNVPTGASGSASYRVNYVIVAVA